MNAASRYDGSSPRRTVPSRVADRCVFAELDTPYGLYPDEVYRCVFAKLDIPYGYGLESGILSLASCRCVFAKLDTPYGLESGILSLAS
jgi:hypothetical protein